MSRTKRRHGMRKHSFVVVVSASSWLTKAQVRREVRTLINEQTTFLTQGPHFQELRLRAASVVSIAPKEPST